MKLINKGLKRNPEAFNTSNRCDLLLEIPLVKMKQNIFSFIDDRSENVVKPMFVSSLAFSFSNVF